MNFFRSLLLVCAAVFLSSCATVTRGVHEKLKVESDPTGANVALSTGEKGVTPAVFVESRRHDNFTVTVSKAGYTPETVTVVSKAGGTGAGAMAGNALIGGVIGIGVDAATGAYDSLYPNPVKVTLKPVGSRGKKSTKAKEKSTGSSPKPTPSSR